MKDGRRGWGRPEGRGGGPRRGVLAPREPTQAVTHGAKALFVTAALIALGGALVAPLAGQDDERYHPFQQDVQYRIEATQDPASHVLTGRARMRYTNHAPEALDRLVFHQYLNAFRPNSAWARADLRAGRRTFQDLGPHEHAFERVTAVTVDGIAVRPSYPHSPDSTVMHLVLSDPLEPGESLEAVIDWRARLSTEPRRQGRRGRHYNWAHWYPRIAFYGADGWEARRHLRIGEFNGTFARYDVTLDLPDDQVIAATGVPVSGDPGWAAAMIDTSEPPQYRRDHYEAGPGDPLGLLEGGASPGRKRVRWCAEDVHHFAWAASPDYRYLGGRWGAVPIHLLWTPDAEEWEPHRILARQREALDWMVWLFGEYPWPQITVTERIEDGGATEYPMLYMTDGGAVVHETVHMFAHGILANNEWKSGWLDEGMANFLSSWLRVEEGADPERVWARSRDYVARLDRAGISEPMGLPGAEFSSYRMYHSMTYTKGSVVLRMLRDMLGQDVFREGLREYYHRYRFRNVTREDFRRVMEDVSGRDLEWFFRQWLDTTDWLDWGVVSARYAVTEDSGYVVTAELRRRGPAWMPVVVRAGDARVVVDSRDRAVTVTLRSRARPTAVVVDPAGSLVDADRGNQVFPLPAEDTAG